MKLEAIKAEMREKAKEKGHDPMSDFGFEQAVQMYERRLDLLDPHEPLRRVGEKVKECCMANGFSHMRSLEFLDIIDAELKEKKEMKKEQFKTHEVKFEVSVPEIYDCVGYGYPCIGEFYIDNRDGRIYPYSKNMNSKAVILRPIAPPLELETDFFVKQDGVSLGENQFHLQTEPGGTQRIELDFAWDMSPSNARDLAKILNYWAETGKLPERVVVKGGK